MTEHEPPIAAVVHKAEVAGANELLASFADDLIGRGIRVRGLVQHDRRIGDGCACSMALRDLDTGQFYTISQNLGPGSTACRIDSSGIAAASVALRRAVAQGADLVVANRFGGLEAAGGGLAQEMLAAMAAGLPFLTLVAERWLGDWLAFTGGAGQVLPPDRSAMDRWVDGIVGLAARRGR